MSSIGGTYGLSGSGMDIDAVVKKLMTGQQAKADALLQKKTVAEWQKTAYNSVYDDINAFRTSVFNYKLQGTLIPIKVASSNTSVATATANSEAGNVSHSLIVSQLADGVKLTSSAKITADGATMGTIAEQLNSVPTGPIEVKISNGTKNATLMVDTSGSINDFVSQINNAGIDVKANYDSTLDRFFLYNTTTGASSGIDFNGSNADGLSFLSSSLKLDVSSHSGKDAIINLDGANGITQSSNTFSISGVTYNLTGTTPFTSVQDPAYPTDPTKTVLSQQATAISVTYDIDKAVSSIQSLVDSYNKILENVNGKLEEARYKDFTPLTDTQKAAMNDTDITAWEAKAKSGMLRNDTTLTSLVNSMRNAFNNPVTGLPGKYNSASSIGITSGNYTEGGKLYLDTDKLKAAINSDPNVLSQLFGASGQTTTNGVTATNTQSQGLAGRLYDGLKTSMDKLAQIAGVTSNAKYDSTSNYAKKIADYTKQISVSATRFTTMESAYYKKYNAMEVALEKLNTQSSWLSSMLGSSSGA